MKKMLLNIFSLLVFLLAAFSFFNGTGMSSCECDCGDRICEGNVVITNNSTRGVQVTLSSPLGNPDGDVVSLDKGESRTVHFIGCMREDIPSFGVNWNAQIYCPEEQGFVPFQSGALMVQCGVTYQLNVQ